MTSTTGLDRLPDWTIGNRIRKVRDDLDLEQADLGAMVGVTRQTISKWERGLSEPAASQVAELCRQTSTSPEWLLGLLTRSRCFAQLAQVDDVGGELEQLDLAAEAAALDRRRVIRDANRGTR